MKFEQPDFRHLAEMKIVESVALPEGCFAMMDNVKLVVSMNGNIITFPRVQGRSMLSVIMSPRFEE